MSYTKVASNRGMFDPNFPLQGIFDTNIFDTELAVAIDRIVLPIFIHGNENITAPVHGNEEITLK
jgi:hypothetical protein